MLKFIYSMEENKKSLNKYLIAALIAALPILLYVFIKIPEFAERKNAELSKSREIIVTIPEGYSARQIGETFERLGIFSKEDFLKIAQKEEGYLFPDTYRFYKNAKPEDVVGKMKDNFYSKITPEILNEIKSSRRGLDKIIIMASILEEEVSATEDRKIVAGILWKRLDLGIGLDVDAAPDTYRYRGLPPAPISNPGLDAILAALRPEPSPYFYYLTGKGGQVHYAKTLEEHALNKFKYLR